MTVPTLPRRWGQILTSGCLLIVLTASVRGSGNVQCGPTSLCGYGTRCDNVTSQCVCLSGNGNLEKKEGNPNTVFYCLGEGVTRCGDQLCGYRAECNPATGQCRCSFAFGVLTRLRDTSPSLCYCVEWCSSGRNSCPDNTTCGNPSSDNSYRCYCSAGATLSSTGQCLGGVSITTKTVRTTQDVNTERTTSISVVDRKQDDLGDSSSALIRGLAVGMGVAILVAFVLAVALVWRIRFFKTREKCECHCAVRQTGHSNVNAPSAVDLGRSNENVVNSSLSGESSGDGRSGLRVEAEAEMQGADVLQGPGVDVPEQPSQNTYANVPSESPYHADTSGLYESANTPVTKLKRRGYNSAFPDSNNWSEMDKTANQCGHPYIDGNDLPLPESRGTENPAYPRVVLETELSSPVQSSNDLSTPTPNANKGDGTYDVSQLYSVVKKPKKTDTTKNGAFEDLYSKAKIPEEKAKQKKQAKSRPFEEPSNSDDTPKYSKAQAANHIYQNIQLGIPESGNPNLAHQRGEYDTSYNIRVKMGPASPSRVDDCDELNLSRV